MYRQLPRTVSRHRFTIEDLERMVHAGVLRPDDRVELIEGELVDMAPIGWAHQGCVNRLTEILVTQLRGRAIVQPQGPLRLSEYSVPQPDLAILRPRSDYYAHGGPTAADVFLVIEVSDTTLAYDRDVKVPLYARHGVPEVWVIDLSGQRVLVYRHPSADGYRSVAEFRAGDHCAPEAFPDLALSVDALLSGSHDG